MSETALSPIGSKSIRGAMLAIALLLFGVYLLALDGHFFSVDEVHHFRMSQSLIDEGSLDVGDLHDAEKGVQGDFQSKKGIGFALATVPVHLVGRAIENVLPSMWKFMTFGVPLGGSREYGGTFSIFFASFSNILISILLCEVCFLMALTFTMSVRVALFYALIVGLSTAFFAYSQSYFEHTLTALCLMTSCYLLIKNKCQQSQRNYLYIGLSMTLGILTRVEVALCLPFLVLYAILTRSDPFSSFSKEVRRYLPLVLSVILGLTIYLGVNYYRYGEFLRFSSIGLDYFDGNILIGLYGHLFSYGKSIFIFSPPLILSCLFWPRFFRESRAEALLFFGLGLFYLIFYSAYRYWDGGWSYGNRYLLLVLPLLMTPLLFCIKDAFSGRRNVYFILIGVFALLGFIVQVLGVATYLGEVFLNWTNQNLMGAGGYLYVWDVSPLVIHWDYVSNAKFLNTWLLFIYEFYGFEFAMKLAAIPLVLALAATIKVALLLRGNREHWELV